MSSLQALASRYLPVLETELIDLLAAAGPLYTEYYNMLHYHMGWLDTDLRPTQGRVGKRVRPLLCMLACESAGGEWTQSVPAAVGVEVLHNFSLVHDDIQDNSDTRRGRPTVWRLWGLPQALNAGDGLFALAHLAFTRLPERGVPVEKAFAALHTFDQTCLALTHGQHLDMQFEDRLDVTADEYLTMITDKTATLIATSAYLGALLAGVDEAIADHYGDFGRHLGLTFQVRDDILGIWGDKGVTGKSTSSDIETRKKTLPVVYGLERSEVLRQLYAQDEVGSDHVTRVIEILDELGARQKAERVAVQHHRKAMDAFRNSAATGEAGQALEELAENLLTRAN